MVVATDLEIALPSGSYGQINPRSGLAAKHFIGIGAGTIDRDYRGPLGIVIFNHGKTPFVIKEGDRIAQLVIIRNMEINPQEVQNLDSTDRGADGFGSTGVTAVRVSEDMVFLTHSGYKYVKQKRPRASHISMSQVIRSGRKDTSVVSFSRIQVSSITHLKETRPEPAEKQLPKEYADLSELFED